MQLLGRNAHFRAHTEFKSIRKARAGIDIHRGAVYLIQKFFRGGLIFRHDAVAVMGAVSIDMRDRLIYPVHDLDRNFQRQKFGIIVLFGRGSQSGNDFSALFARDDFDMLFLKRRNDFFADVFPQNFRR